MKTINELIAERVANTALRRRIACEDNILAVYAAHPKLAAIDNDLLEIRKSKLIAAVDHDDKPVPALEVREKELFEERQSYIKDNNFNRMNQYYFQYLLFLDLRYHIKPKPIHNSHLQAMLLFQNQP